MTVWTRKTLLAGTCALGLFALAACGDDNGDEPERDAGQEPGDGDGAGDGAGDGDGGAPGDGDAGSPGDGDAGGETPDVASCLADAQSQETDTERLVFSADGLAVGFVRHQDPDSFGTSGTRVWLADRVAVAGANDAACVSDSASLEYTSSYHNFDDALSASVDDVVYTITQKRQGYDDPTAFAITKQRGDTVVYGPTPLTLESCTRLNDDSDCSDWHGAP